MLPTVTPTSAAAAEIHDNDHDDDDIIFMKAIITGFICCHAVVIV